MSVVESLLAAGQGVVHLKERMNISAVAMVLFSILSLSLSYDKNPSKKSVHAFLSIMPAHHCRVKC